MQEYYYIQLLNKSPTISLLLSTYTSLQTANSLLYCLNLIVALAGIQYNYEY